MRSLFRLSAVRLALGLPAQTGLRAAEKGGGEGMPFESHPHESPDPGPSTSGNAGCEHSHVCEICQESLPLGSFIQLDCSHRFCIDCLSQHGKITVQSKSPVKCPAPRCGQHVSAGTCELFLDRETQASLLLLLAELSIPESERFYCPRKECSLLMVAELQSGAEALATCHGCGHNVCIACKTPWHSGMTCSAFKAMPAGERGVEDLQLQELARSKGWRRCHKCKHWVERNQGCNHMTCRCKAEWCYSCGKQYVKKKQQCKC